MRQAHSDNLSGWAFCFQPSHINVGGVSLVFSRILKEWIQRIAHCGL